MSRGGPLAGRPARRPRRAAAPPCPPSPRRRGSPAWPGWRLPGRCRSESRVEDNRAAAFQQLEIELRGVLLGAGLAPALASVERTGAHVASRRPEADRLALPAPRYAERGVMQPLRHARSPPRPSPEQGPDVS